MFPQVSTNVYIPIIDSICTTIETTVAQVPVIGAILSSLISGYCFVTTSFISLWPLQAFGLVPPPFTGS